MYVRGVTVVVGSACAAVAVFGLGAYSARRVGERRALDAEMQIRALRAEVDAMRHSQTARPSGTSGTVSDDVHVPAIRAAIVEDVKRQLQAEMGLLPVQLLRQRRDSFVELYSYDNFGKSSYGTAGYLGDGYFITVKHGVVALPDTPGHAADGSPRRRIVSIKLIHGKKTLKARVVDAGSARFEVDPGDWAIIKVREAVELPPLSVNLDFAFEFAEPIFRLGNDYSKGIIASTGYVGQKTANGLVTCLTDGHPGVSGGGVLDLNGELVGIPVGRMQGDYRFSFILPVRREMFRKVPGVLAAE